MFNTALANKLFKLFKSKLLISCSLLSEFEPLLVFRNCYITEHNVTLQVDGTQEESMTLMSYTDPKIYDGIKGGEWDDATDATEL